MNEHETNFRSLVKSVTWRVTATITTIVLVYIFTGDLTSALSVGAIEVVLKFLIYFTHERIWDRVEWGKQVIEDE